MDRDAAVQALVDTLHRYASFIDGRDLIGPRAVFADDATARYGDRDWMSGTDEIVGWIGSYSERQA